MRLFVVVPDFHPNVSGYGNACVGFVEALSATGSFLIDVFTLVGLESESEVQLSGVRVHRIAATRAMFFSRTLAQEISLIRTMKRLASQRPDFVLFETAEFPLAALYALRLFPGRVIVRIHASADTEWVLFRRDFHYRWKRPFTRLLLRRVPCIFSTTRHYLQFIKTRFLDDDPLAIAQKRLLVMPNALPSMERSVATMSRRPTQSKDISLLSLGRMDRAGELQKNFGRLLAAVARLRGAEYFSRLRIQIVGSGDMLPVMKRLVTELDIETNVQFHERLNNDQVQRLQRECDAVILASTFEGLSVFALESLRNGAPLLVSDHSGLSDLVRDRANGLLFDPLDVSDIAEKIRYFIEVMLPNLDSVRAASRSHFDANFSNERLMRAFAEELAFLAALRRSQAGSVE